MTESFQFVRMASFIGPLELVLILVIVIIVFGADKLANLGGALGKGIREFREATKEEEEAERQRAAENRASEASETAAAIKADPSEADEPQQ